jgi:uncharacterized membrane protein YkgB
MNFLIKPLIKLRIERQDLEYHLIRAWMVVFYLFFGYQKWFEYEAQALVPFIRNGPFISWMFPLFGMRGATYFLGFSKGAFGALLFLGCWNKKLGILGALVRAGVSDLYYPRQERTWRQARQKWLLQIGIDAVFDMGVEFWPDINHHVFHDNY